MKSSGYNKMLFLGEVKNKILNIFGQEEYTKYISSLEGRIKIDLRPFGNDRTALQNNYYWMYLRVIAEETGDNPEDLHEFFKQKFIGREFKVVMGEEVQLQKSTTRLTKKEFSEYISRIESLTQISAPAEELYLYN